MNHYCECCKKNGPALDVFAYQRKGDEDEDFIEGEYVALCHRCCAEKLADVMGLFNEKESRPLAIGTHKFSTEY